MIIFGVGIGLPVLPALLFESECSVEVPVADGGGSGCNIFDSDIVAAARTIAVMFAVNKIVRRVAAAGRVLPRAARKHHASRASLAGGD